MNKYYSSMVINDMNSTELQYIKIFGLFGRYNINIPFDKEVNIFIGENGLGKTTILSCIYYVLEKKYNQLENISFDSIEVKFKREKTALTITKSDLLSYNRKRDPHRVRMDEDFFEYFFSELGVSPEKARDLAEEDMNILIQRYSDFQDIPFRLAQKRFYSIWNAYKNFSSQKKVSGNEKNVHLLSKAVSNHIGERIIYLPTYRRIENDFSNLNIRNDEINNSEMLIRFGMADVQKSIDSILDEIRALAMQGYNEMAGILLRQYAQEDEFKNMISNIHDSINLEIVKIVLDRLGEKIDNDTKKDIIHLIETKEIYRFDHIHLLNLLHKLCANYDLQKRYDDRIQGFVSTCNKYLNDKHFMYDPSSLTLEIYLNDQDVENRTVKLTQLSSGEKQIVSLFSRLYLESEEKSIVVIDEPELSLSLSWQQMLLPDIMRSRNCSLLITVTHSPFIFENEFDLDAREIRAYMSMC